MPEVGDRIEFDEHVLQVIEVDGHRAARLRIEPLPAPGDAAEDGSEQPATPGLR